MSVLERCICSFSRESEGVYDNKETIRREKEQLGYAGDADRYSNAG